MGPTGPTTRRMFARLKVAGLMFRSKVKGVITATRGNHGQSLAFACARAGIACTVVVPFGNSAEKNAAMKAFGAELIEHGRDFDEARERAEVIAAERGYEYGKSFDRDLVLGVATYAYELFTAEPELDAVYVPIGLGSGICGAIAARDALARKARVIGVVSDRANTYRLSLDAGRAVPTNSALTFADGMAVRIPDAEALGIIRRGMIPPKTAQSASSTMAREDTSVTPMMIGTSACWMACQASWPMRLVVAKAV